jgi:hypothetical protein
MRNPERSPLDGIIAALPVALLVALLLTNLAFYVRLRTGGPLVGLAFYLVLLAITFRQDRASHRPVMLGGLLGLAVHVVEVVAMGWPVNRALMALNLLLPAGLALAPWVADGGSWWEAGNR